MTMTDANRNRIIVISSALLLLLAYHLIFRGFFPSANGSMGEDYSYFLPSLLDGYFWSLNNGALTNQWFSPAFCGGLPTFPNPQNIYYSLPQWLTFVTDPVTAVYLTLLIFALLGFIGMYLLLRTCFQLSLMTALAGAALFMFNSFYSDRMLIGHLSYHAFMLTPLIAYFLLRPLSGRTRPLLWTLVDASFAGICLAYMVYSGMVHLILPLLLALVAIALIHGLMFGHHLHFWLRLAGAGVISLSLGGAKLVASFAFLSHFQRSDYLLPGAKNVWETISLAFQTLFLTPTSELSEQLTNLQWVLARHEFEYGITWVPLLLVALIIAFTAMKRPRLLRPSGRQWLLLGATALILILPLAVNTYTPDWNAFLKQLPILRNSSNLLRWFCVYIPLVILIVVIAFDKAPIPPRLKIPAAAVAVIAVPIAIAIVDRDYYSHQAYSPDHILKAYDEYRAVGKPPTIANIILFRDQQGRIQTPVYRNDTLVKGGSQLACYEPMFGYRLEHLPVGPMRPGRVDQIIGDVFNLKNPACYVFDQANHCQPGDHISVNNPAAAQAFASYQPLPFELPTKQIVADRLSLAMLAGLLLLWMAAAILAIKQKRKGTDG